MKRWCWLIMKVEPSRTVEIGFVNRLRQRLMFSQFLRSLFRFRKTSVSVLLVLTYVAIGSFLLWDQVRYQYSLPVDDDEYMKLLNTSWLDLKNITRSPHPYSSRANNDVHDYLVQRVTDIVASVEYAEISDDDKSGNHLLFKQPDVFNSSSTESRVVSFESSNVLVKILGKEPGLSGLLLSAHFDSVPTAPGATDDGMGVVSLLALLSRYAKHQPRRTLIFNFNNNEEFGLLGASAFLNHPWSSLVEYVLNLEGAGAGGKAVLFRTSDASTASMYKNAVKVQPFGNSIYQQGFYDRYISSETDYKVYEQAGLRGWDIAFYKPRALYHTAKDSIQYASKFSLWHMMHAALQLTEYIAFEALEDEPRVLEPAVYFDLLGKKFFSMSAKDLFTWNVVLLVVIPIIILLLKVVLIKRKTRQRHSLLAWLRLPCSLLVSYAIISAGRSLLFRNNPLIFSRDYISPTLGFAFGFLIVNYLLLSFFEHLSPTQDFKTVALIELSFGLWVALLLVTIRLYSSKFRATGVYVITALYLFISLGGIMGFICAAFKRKNSEVESITPEDGRRNDTYGSVEDGQPQERGDSAQNGSSSEQADERAPLLPSSNSSRSSSVSDASRSGHFALSTMAQSTFNYDWSLQFLIAVPFASFFALACSCQVLDAVYQTCQDGFQASWNVSMISMLGGMVVILPFLPFSYKMNYFVSMLVILVGTCAGLCAFLKAPFSESSPLKLRFSQEIKLNENSTVATVNVFGRQGAGIAETLGEIPSVILSGSDVKCTWNGEGQETCSYPGEPPNLVNSATELSFSDIMSIEVLSNNRESPGRSSYEPIKAEFRINVKENRLCTIKFNSSQFEERAYGQSPVKQVTIYKNRAHDNRTTDRLSVLDGQFKDGNGNRAFKWNKGINSLQLHKLDFDQGYYHVGVQWIPAILSQDLDEDWSDALGLSVRCFWGEYDSSTVVNGVSKRKIPSFDELLTYSPKEILYSNREAGLVAISDYVEL